MVYKLYLNEAVTSHNFLVVNLRTYFSGTTKPVVSDFPG